jgi:hypothetical protein
MRLGDRAGMTRASKGRNEVTWFLDWVAQLRHLATYRWMLWTRKDLPKIKHPWGRDKSSWHAIASRLDSKRWPDLDAEMKHWGE